MRRSTHLTLVVDNTRGIDRTSTITDRPLRDQTTSRLTDADDPVALAKSCIDRVAAEHDRDALLEAIFGPLEA